MLTKSSYFATQFEYSRSRQRICRGWILNFILLAISLNTLLLLRPEAFTRAIHLKNFNPWHVSYFATPALILLAFASLFAWEKLYDTELKRMKDQAQLLRDIDADSRDRG